MTRSFWSILFTIAATIAAAAVTRLPSADGQFWDVQDTSTWAQDSGGIATGGGANPFDGFGYLKIEVQSGAGEALARNRYLHGFGLAYDGAERFDSIMPVYQDGIVVARSIFAPKDTNYLRYVDSYTNVAGQSRSVRVAWGGASGAFDDGGRVTVATTSNGDRRIDLTDSFVTVMQNARGAADPMRGPSGHGPSAHVLGAKTSGVLVRIGDMYGDPFIDPWPGFDPGHIGYVFSFTLGPGRTSALMTFVVKGLSEVYDPRGGWPIPIRDGLVTPKHPAPYSQGAPVVPPPGSQIAAVTETARRLVRDPDLRGLTARQRAQLLNWTIPGNSAKSVRELALVLDQVAGVDPEDEATLDADRRTGRPFAETLDPSALHNARIGLVRQLFVGVTGEREVATMMERVVEELRAAGATVVDVAIPDLDAAYRAARGSAPGSLKAGWTAYLTRGAAPGEQVLTIEDLLASGKLAPESTRRFEDALRQVPAGEALREATAKFYAGRDQFRSLFVTAMEQHHLDALLYPANQARPHTHEGGLERYGGEPGTCEESAMAGLPQVTVPAGFIGGRYPFGISFLGRLWSDRQVLSLAYAYEQATHHRRPPPMAR